MRKLYRSQSHFPLLIIAAVCALCSPPLHADIPDLPPGFRVHTDGRLALDEIEMGIQHFAKDGRATGQSSRSVTGSPAVTRESWQLDGRFTCAGSQTFALAEKIARTAANSLTYAARLTAAEPVPTQQLALAINLPVHTLAGVSLRVGDE